MTVQELKEMVGKTVTDVEYESESNTAVIIFGSGYGLQVEVEREVVEDK